MPFTVKNAAAAASTKRPSEGAASDESPAKRAAAPLYANLTLLDAPKRNSVQRLPPSAPVVLCAYKVLLAVGESVSISEKKHDRSRTGPATYGRTMKAWWTPPCSKCRSTTQPAQVPWTFGQLASHLSMIEFARWVHSRYCVRSQGKFQRLLERCEQQIWRHPRQTGRPRQHRHPSRHLRQSRSRWRRLRTPAAETIW